MASLDHLGRRKRVVKYYPYDSHHGVLGAAGVSVSAHTGAAVQQEVGALGVVGLLLDTAGDMVNMLTPVPHDVNVVHPIGVRVVYQTASATAADTIDWIVLYDVITEGTALAVGTTALDTAIAQETVTGVAEALEFSNRGEIIGNTLTEPQMANAVSFFSWNIEMDAFAAGLTEDKIFLGLSIDYVPKRWQGSPSIYNPALTDD
jgi:hypothetical protein